MVAAGTGQSVDGVLTAIETRLDELADVASRADAPAVLGMARELLGIGERVLEVWIEARGGVPTETEKEGFRILGLHRQGARGEPSFNACRETARELVYRYNVIEAAAARSDTIGDLRREVALAIMVARHLCLFISGKLTEAGLGEFCCSAKPVRSVAG